MKRLFALLMLALPLTVTAADFSVEWVPYEYPQATMTATCDVNGVAPDVVGSALASAISIPFVLTATHGDTVTCSVVASYMGKESDPGIGSIVVPFPDLPIPTVNVILIAP